MPRASRRARATHRTRVWERYQVEVRDVASQAASQKGSTQQSIFEALFQWAYDNGLTTKGMTALLDLVFGGGFSSSWLTWALGSATTK